MRTRQTSLSGQVPAWCIVTIFVHLESHDHQQARNTQYLAVI